MLEQITIENFQQMLGQYTTPELEVMVEKFPYFQQAHLLLAKKYQQENNAKFDQQLQLAALYVQDRELLFQIFNEKKLLIASASVVEKIIAPFEEKEAPIQNPEEEITMRPEEVTEAIMEEKQKEQEILNEPPMPHEEELSFSRFEAHTFDEWLKAFNKTSPTENIAAKKDALTDDASKQELDTLIKQNISVDYLHKMVQEETQYSRGLDEFIEEQIEKHKHGAFQSPPADNELSPELITETMAKVYEMQKKYAKAIRAYEILTLKFPEKSSFFAARINFLRNIV